MISKYVTAALVAAMMAAPGGSFAKSLALKDEILPAEFPPASFKGGQYVDSRGCVFIRAGIDGATTWVPRVSRARTVICGFKPSLPKGQGTAIVQNTGPAPVQIVPDDAASVKAKSDGAVKSAAAAQKSAPRPLFARKAKPAAAPQPVQIKPAPVKRAAAPMRTVASISTMPRPLAPAPQVVRPAPVALATPQAAPRPVQVSRAVPAAPACHGASAISSKYIGSSSAGLPVRCGPQQGGSGVSRNSGAMGMAPVSASDAPQMAAVPLQQLAPSTRIIPRHVYEARKAAGNEEIKAPKGYRRAWDDGRLNPRRAEQTVAGVQAMDLRWTKTVPRKLYDARDGRVVNKLFPNLRYPFTSMAQQQAASATVVARADHSALQSGARLSTRRSPAAAPTSTRAVASAHQYVQVGSFGQSDNAARTAAKLKAMGLPVRMGKANALTVVMAGPFASTSHLQGALLAVRKAGFTDAFSR